MTQRDMTLDVTKGVAIIAIVAGHVWRGLENADLIASNSMLFDVVDRSLYMFHLTAFAFAAGLFVQRGMRRDGAWPYARARDLEFLWLYVIWSTVQVGAKIALGGSVHNPVSPWDLLTLWEPKEQFWFFGWIALMMILAAAVQPWRSRLWLTMSSAGAFCLSVAMWGAAGPFIGMQGLSLTMFFWAGLLIGGGRMTRIIGNIPLFGHCVVVIVGGAAMVGLVIAADATPGTMSMTGPGRTLETVAPGVVATVIGLVATLSLSAVLARIPIVGDGVAYAGKRSLAIFVTHVFLMAAARMVMLRLGVGDVATHLLVGTIIGVAGSILLAELCARTRFRWLYAAPAAFTGARATRPASPLRAPESA